MLLLLAASFVNAAIPGPCVMLTFGRTARAGARAGAAVSAGALVADLLLVSAALASVLGFYVLSATGFEAMKWFGIALLVALALHCLRAGNRPAGDAAPVARRRDEVAGFLVALTSPYNLVFYLALVPQAMVGPPGPAEALAVVATALTGIFLAQVGVVALALWCRGAFGFGGRWIDYAAAGALLAVAGTAAMVPVGTPLARDGRPAAPIEINAR